MKDIGLNSSLTLPCGAVLKNRLVKSAMTERISDSDFMPTKGHNKLYKKWAATGAGLLITGNVVIDRKHLESAGNVCLDTEEMIPALEKWVKAGTSNGNHLWVQISHSGRQTNIFNSKRPKAPSEVKLNKMGLFGKPRAMTEADIAEVIEGFVRAASIAKKAGFTGIQIHSAHGYLLSQFLSPITNKRQDRWGGSLENRSRLLRIIVEEVRKEVGSEYPISVKLNSSDFQRGGFSEEDSLEVVKMLNDLKIDLLEISGGTYEKLAFFLLNEEQKESTKKREAYFIDFAKKIQQINNVPLLVTGGFRSYDFCNEVLASGEIDLIGMGRPFITNLDEISDFLKGDVKVLDNMIIRTGIKNFEDGAEGGFYARQLIRISKGKPFKANLNSLYCSMFIVIHEFKKAVSNKFMW
ncbi:NADH:flavin oxidoreductase/NADH oxidase family protein [Marinigracilibium pacificum]|uniref:NADH:flavin oxidoreductase/NADH oxidase family protein n=1 Tax=Marinigracilibium pacificum TaxID=2729599 RepID=A0A848J116_9BACT|nr:NADH:flavin oxidoreductase/NADH oxidase family protein [Marinigracilibium pacificum]NMM49048.1 NADH:flavin oxidoreductase/NADH oxidase family protein [Marinigracilibium pacificum]